MSRKIIAADLDFIYGLYMHPDINPYLLYEMMDAKSFAAIFTELLHKGIIYVYETDGVPAGMFKLMPQQHRNAHIAYLGGVAIHPSYAGKGYGIKMMQEIIALGSQMDLLRIELSTAVANDKAIRLYEKVGFVKEGVLRKYTRLKSEERFLDEVLMSYLY